MNKDITLPIGQKVILLGHFDAPVILEDARMLGTGYEYRLPRPGGILTEAVLSFREAASLAKSFQPTAGSAQLANPEKIRLLMESGTYLVGLYL